MIEKFKVALLQVTSTARVSQNLQKCRLLAEEARREGASFLALPENFSFMGSEQEKKNLLGEITSETIQFLEETSQDLGVYLLAGGFPTAAPSGKVYNTAILFSPEGKECLRYHKAHLFQAEVGDGITYRESDSTESGNSLPNKVETPFGIISTAICYDLRFPELFRALSKEGLDILCLPAAFTIPTGEAHWHVLLRARAIENFIYVLAPAQTGTHDPHGRRKTYGHSLIVSPWGEVLADGGTKEGVVTAWIDLGQLREVRKKIPALEHRIFG